jgi:hypothetical protein
MATADIEELCRVALEEESNWREGGSESRRNAYERFQDLVRKIAELTDRTYEEVMNDAIEEWVTVHFCALPTETGPSEEWEAAAHASPSST